MAGSLCPNPRWTIPKRDRVSNTATEVKRSIQMGRGKIGMDRLKIAASHSGQLPPGAG
jgi:hypothetical protein